MAEPESPAAETQAAADSTAGRHNGDVLLRRPAEPRSAADTNPNLLRDRLANERTFLAWLRTGITITSLGFVVARFDIFLQQLARVSLEPGAVNSVEQTINSQAAVPIGVVLVLAGPVIVLMAAMRYLHTERALLAGRSDSRRLVRYIVVVITTGGVIAGVALAVHLIAVWPK